MKESYPFGLMAHYEHCDLSNNHDVARDDVSTGGGTGC